MPFLNKFKLKSLNLNHLSPSSSSSPSCILFLQWKSSSALPQIASPKPHKRTQMQYKLGDSTFNSLLQSYAASGDFASLENLLRRMKHENRLFLETSFITIFKAYGNAHLPEKALDLFYRMVRDFRCKRTVRSFNSVLNVLIHERLYARALEFYSSVFVNRGGGSDMGFVPNVLSFNLIIKAMCKLGFVDRAVETFREEMLVNKCVPDVFTYCTLMDGLCKEGRIEEAVSLLDEMQSEGCFPNPPTFNVLLNALCKQGKLGRAAKLLDNMLLKGCVPNQVTYNTLIHGLCLHGKLDKAVGLLDRMIACKCMPNDVTYGTIINGLVKHGRAVDGLAVLKFLEDRGSCVNEYVYSALLGGLFKERRFELARRLWEEMVEKGFRPNSVIYCTLIDGICQEEKLDEAWQILMEMRNSGFPPNAFAYSSLLRGFYRMGDTHKAISLWEKIEDNVRNEVCYSVHIHGLCEEGKIEEAEMIWKEMLLRGFRPDVVAYSSMIHGFCNAGAIERGLQLFDEMLFKDTGCQPDVVTYNILFNALCKRGSVSRAINLLKSMLDRDCDPDLWTCNIFLRALAENLDPPQDGREFLDELVIMLLERQRTGGASKILEVMLRKCLVPKVLTWEKAVKQLCKPKKVQAAINKCWIDIVC